MGKFVFNKTDIEGVYIIEPTVFIRYCMNAEEVYCIEKRYQNIKDIFTGFNEQNEIIFLTHDDIDISKVPSIENIFIIQKGDNESESKTPIIDCEVLYTLLNNAKFEKRNENLEFYYRKHDNTSIEYRIRKRIRKIKKHIHKHKKYAHEKQI